MPGPVPLVFFEILGPLRARREENELDLGPGKQRAVLAVLLLNANRPTPTARIIDAVWGDCPPENGVNVVQKYVAGLRRILEPGRSPRSPGHLLTWTEAGYTLHVPPGCIDADVFHDGVARALAARAEGHAADAAARLRAALGLWREAALAGLPGAYFDGARERLAEDRAAAFEEAAQIELDLGQHARLVPELGRLVTDFPLREQLRYLLILALYRCGRQAEALAAYQDARAFLTEEFGVEPGERLQQLHLSILRSDRTLSPRTAPPPPAPVPASPARRRWWPLRALAVAVPLVSFGLFTWAAMAFLAVRRRSLAVGATAFGYLLLVVAFVVISDDDPNSAREGLSVLALLISMAGGAVHMALLVTGTPARQRRGGQRLRRPPDYDTLRSLELRIRREQALTLLDHHPRIARELRIGRPDLARVFNDGGLVDVNAVPEHILAALPGVTVPQAQQIVARRRAMGAFSSVDDLVSGGLLPLPTVRALSDVLIVIDGEPQDTPPVPAHAQPNPSLL
jgi:DNA-binding SARP family transcriptional activator